MTHMDFSVISPLRVPQGHMSGITDNLAVFSGFSSFFHVFEYKKKFVLAYNPKDFSNFFASHDLEPRLGHFLIRQSPKIKQK